MKKLLKDYSLTELMQEAVKHFQLNDNFVVGSFNGACKHPIPFNYKFHNSNGDIDIFYDSSKTLCVETKEFTRIIPLYSTDIGDFFAMYGEAFEETSAKAV